MKKIRLLAMFLIVLSFVVHAQRNIDDILIQIDKNNSFLAAMRKSIDAQKTGNKTGIYLQNPEIEFNYLFGNPSSTGNRQDFSFRQTFDFPSAYLIKNKISDIKNEQSELEFLRYQKEILLKARIVCIDLIYNNALKSEYKNRFSHAQELAKLYKLKFDAGDVNILEYNKSQLNLLNIQNKVDLIEIDRTSLVSELNLLNGGINIELTESVFQTPIITSNFDQWFTSAEVNNPLLAWLRHEIEIGKKQISLTKAQALPKMQAGYMSETVVGQQFRGVSVGFSVPLWENKNSVKFAKANAQATEAIASDNKMKVYNELKALHARATFLQSNLTEYQSKLQLFSNKELLKKALDKGEISLIEYLLELSLYYENTNKLLELERDLNKVVVELNYSF
jgi:outer membrane protein TolC